MTLILALVCTDGIIMASDGQATFATSGGFMKLPTEEKISSLGGRVLWGGSGDVGLLQKIKISLGRVGDPGWQHPIAALRSQIGRLVLDEQKGAAQSYIPVVDQFPKPTAHVLFAGYDGDNPWVLEVDPNGSDTQLEEFGFAAVGSGGHFAYSVLSISGRRALACRAGKVVAYKVVYEAINVAAFGLGLPIQMWELRRGGVPTCLSADDIRAIGDTYGSWVQVQHEELAQLTAPPAPEAPPAPPAPPQ